MSTTARAVTLISACVLCKCGHIQRHEGIAPTDIARLASQQCSLCSPPAGMEPVTLPISRRDRIAAQIQEPAIRACWWHALEDAVEADLLIAEGCPDVAADLLAHARARVSEAQGIARALEHRCHLLTASLFPDGNDTLADHSVLELERGAERKGRAQA